MCISAFDILKKYLSFDFYVEEDNEGGIFYCVSIDNLYSKLDLYYCPFIFYLSRDEFYLLKDILKGGFNNESGSKKK